MNDRDKNFGPHVKAFYGKLNGSELTPFVAVSPDDDAEYGEWMTVKQAETFAKNILKAVDHLRKVKP